MKILCNGCTTICFSIITYNRSGEWDKQIHPIAVILWYFIGSIINLLFLWHVKLNYIEYGHIKQVAPVHSNRNLLRDRAKLELVCSCILFFWNFGQYLKIMQSL